MTTTMSNLPKELSEEILSRVPLRSVRLTCRKWNDLCQSESFRKLHLGKLSAAMKEGETQMVAMIGNNSYLRSIVVDKEDTYIEHNGKLSLLDEQDEISEIFHCEGLLLCTVKYDSRFLAWNPYLGQTRWIEPIFSHHSFRYALGYEDKKKGKSCRSLKLLYYYWDPNNRFFGYEMYDFDSDMWRTLDVTPLEIYSSPGVALKGNTYWCARERNSDREEVLVDRIICFDFTSERFGPLLPLPFIAEGDDFVTLSSVREEKLAVLLTRDDGDPYEFDIWITNKIEAQEVSWSKFLKMDMGIMVPHVQDMMLPHIQEEDMVLLHIQDMMVPHMQDEDVMVPHIEDEDLMAPHIAGSFFIDEERKVVMGYDEYSKKFVIIGESGYVNKLDILGEPADPYWTPHLCAYVPNFLQIKRKEAAEQLGDLPLLKSHYAGGRKRSKRMRRDTWIHQ